MNTTQIVLITILSMTNILVFGYWLYRSTDLNSDHLWIEPVIFVVIGLFIYLVAK